MRIAVISDIHLGPAPLYFGANRLMAAEAIQILPQIVQQIREVEKPDIVFQLGDLIHEDMKNPSKDEDRANYMRALEILSLVGAPIYHALGNHDLVTLNASELGEILGYPKPYISFDYKGYHFTILYSDCAGHTNMTISAEQIEWLKEDLNKATLPTAIFLHHPLIEQPLENHYWFEGKPEKAFIKNASEIRQIIFDSNKVVFVCNGHLHENRYAVVKNIPFITVQAVSEDFKNNGTPSASYTIIDFNHAAISVTVKGKDPVSYLLTR